jgi:hypothetical protein
MLLADYGTLRASGTTTKPWTMRLKTMPSLFSHRTPAPKSGVSIFEGPSIRQSGIV